MLKYRLITTNFSREQNGYLDAVPSVNKILYLGKWCLPFEEKLSEGDTYVPYHWDCRERALKDSFYLQTFGEKILIATGKKLNQIHGLQIGSAAWRIMIGYWLQQFLTVAFDRWQVINEVRAMQLQVFTELHKYRWSDFVPRDSDDAGNSFINNEWNHIFIGEIIQFVGGIEIRQSEKNIAKIQGRLLDRISLLIRKRVKIEVKRLLSSMVSHVMSTRHESNLEITLAVGGLTWNDVLNIRRSVDGLAIYQPQFPLYSHSKCSDKLRRWEIPVDEGDSDFEKYVKTKISKWIPTIFIEGFNEIWCDCSKSDIPQRKHVIVTQTRHFSDDPFKIWLANKVNCGAKAIVVQHGGGLNKFNGALQFEVKMADYYVVNGSGDQTALKNRKVGQMWGQIEYGKRKPNGAVLMISVTMPQYAFDLRSMVIAGQIESYFNDQYIFYSNLPEKIRHEIRVRLYKVDYGWHQKTRWLKQFPEIKFDNHHRSVRISARRSRVIICTYNASNYLEALSANVPTIIFWDPKLWEIPDWAEADFRCLGSVGIFHETPESAARQLIQVWDCLENWWNSQDLQVIRQRFCSKYALKDRSVVNRLNSVIKEASLAI